MTQKGLRALTDREKQLIEENYDLIELICSQLKSKMNANASAFEEMENIANYEICLLAQTYDETKSSFRTYIGKYLKCRIMDSLCRDYSHGIKNMDFNKIKFCYDVDISPIDEIADSTSSTSCVCCCDAMNLSDIMLSLEKLCNKQEKAIVNWLTSGYSLDDIIRLTDFGRTKVYTLYRNIKENLLPQAL